MFNNWTPFNKVLMIVSLMANVVMLIIGVCALSDAFYWFEKSAWIFVVAGLFGIIMVHSIWGLFIEMSKNIIRIGERTSGRGSGDPFQQNGNSRIAQAAAKLSSISNEMQNAPKPANQVPPAPAQPSVPEARPWKCTSCGSVNSPSSSFCQGCGQAKSIGLWR